MMGGIFSDKSSERFVLYGPPFLLYDDSMNQKVKSILGKVKSDVITQCLCNINC